MIRPHLGECAPSRAIYAERSRLLRVVLVKTFAVHTFVSFAVVSGGVHLDSGYFTPCWGPESDPREVRGTLLISLAYPGGETKFCCVSTPTISKQNETDAGRSHSIFKECAVAFWGDRCGADCVAVRMIDLRFASVCSIEFWLCAPTLVLVPHCWG